MYLKKKTDEGIDLEWRLATVSEARKDKAKIITLLEEWDIAQLDGGRIDGAGYNNTIQQCEPEPFGHMIVVCKEYKKLKSDESMPSGWRLALFDEVCRDKAKILPMLDEWDIAMFDGGKIQGSGYGNKIVEQAEEPLGHMIVVSQD